MISKLSSGSAGMKTSARKRLLEMKYLRMARHLIIQAIGNPNEIPPDEKVSIAIAPAFRLSLGDFIFASLRRAAE